MPPEIDRDRIANKEIDVSNPLPDPVMARLVVQTGHIRDTCSETSLTLLGCVV